MSTTKDAGYPRSASGHAPLVMVAVDGLVDELKNLIPRESERRRSDLVVWLVENGYLSDRFYQDYGLEGAL